MKIEILSKSGKSPFTIIEVEVQTEARLATFEYKLCDLYILCHKCRSYEKMVNKGKVWDTECEQGNKISPKRYDDIIEFCKGL
jgi:hypothetical protein